MPKNEMTCNEKVLSRLAKDGVHPSMFLDGMSKWIELSCALGLPDQEISKFVVKMLDWQSILEAVKDYNMSPDELADLKSRFFAGKLTMTQALDHAKAESDAKKNSVKKAKSEEMAKSVADAAKSRIGQGAGSSD